MTREGEQLPGAYGFRVDGLGPSPRNLALAPDSWPLLSIELSTGPATVENRYLVDGDHLEIRTFDQTGQIGDIRMDRDRLRARFTSPGGFSEPAVVHPDLALLAAVANRWRGRDVYHAGAFATDAGAWGVMGAREAGKSSLMGMLAVNGVDVLADDAVAVDEVGRALAGPRCVDLREGAATWLGHGTDIGMIGARQRWRMDLQPTPHAVPLRGWIIPAWGAQIEWQEVPVQNRGAVLLANLYLGLGPCNAVQFLDMMALPFLVFRRPRRWEMADIGVAALLDRLDGIQH